MKAAQVLAVLGFVGASVAQSLHPDLPPAPTESVGCEPHGDHWHCEGPATAVATPSDVTSASAPEVTDGGDHDDHDHEHGDDDHSHDHSDESGSVHPDLPPSPTASVGCEPHGDHWHCEGPVVTETEAAVSESGSVHPDLPPSPTASVGCEPHGDHWHCEGPVATETETVVSESISITPSASSDAEDAEESVPAAGAVGMHIGAGAVVAAALLAL